MCGCHAFGWPGGDLLSRALRRSTLGAEGFDGRVRNGIGFGAFAWATRPAKRMRLGCRVTAGLSGAPFPFGIGGHGRMRAIKIERAISKAQLRALPRVHMPPINVVVFHGSSGRTRFKEGFPLRCLQRLSRPHIATLQCGWRHNRSTRGASIPVLSY